MAEKEQAVPMEHAVGVGRVYDEPVDDGRTRVLVDRIWPRGLSKQSARLDEWAKSVAPSTELRTWYGHEAGKFIEFRSRYRRELAEPERREAVERLRDRARRKPLTLLTATRDVTRSHAAVLAELLREPMSSRPDEDDGPVR